MLQKMLKYLVWKLARDDKYIHSISEYKDLLSHLQSKFNYRESVIPYLLYFLFKTGFRVGEGMALCWSDIDFKQQNN